MRVLVACEFSGVVRDAFIDRGHDAMSCDILPTERPGPHYQGDVFDLLANERYDLIIAHPPCTYLSNSGGHWLHRQQLRWQDLIDGAVFFRDLLMTTAAPRIAVENPVMHGWSTKIIGQKHSQTIQPWQFGEDASKRTCLWLVNLPPLEPTNVLKKKQYANQTASGQNKLGPSPDRAKLRSVTYPGIAEAMADQWGSLPPLLRP